MAERRQKLSKTELLPESPSAEKKQKLEDETLNCVEGVVDQLRHRQSPPVNESLEESPPSTSKSGLFTCETLSNLQHTPPKAEEVDFQACETLDDSFISEESDEALTEQRRRTDPSAPDVDIDICAYETLNISDEIPGDNDRVRTRWANTSDDVEPDVISSENGETYRMNSKIGDGAYGTVYKANDFSNGQQVALKKIKIRTSGDGLPGTTIREIALLTRLKDQNNRHIVKLLDICRGDPDKNPIDGFILYLVLEYVDRDLDKFIRSYRPRGGVPPALVKQMSREIIDGVYFLHSQSILHRDLKPQNILVTKENTIKIADFGLSKVYPYENALTSTIVTLWYRAPEVILQQSYATPVDMWSVGCVLAELNTLNPIFPGQTDINQLNTIFRIIGKPAKEDWPQKASILWEALPDYTSAQGVKAVLKRLCPNGVDLITKLLTFRPTIRMTAKRALQHPYFESDDT